MNFPLLRLVVLSVAFVSLHSQCQAQNMGLSPEARALMSGLLSRYQKVSSYSDTTDVIVSTAGAKPNTSVHTTLPNRFAYKSGSGLRLEGTRDKKEFVVRIDGRNVHQHWLKGAGGHSTTPIPATGDYLSGTEFDYPGLAIISGTWSMERLNRIKFDEVSASQNGTYAGPKGPLEKVNSVSLGYNEGGRHINLILVFGMDNVLYLVNQYVVDGANSYGTTELHSDIQFGPTLPDAYWTTDTPLMGDVLKSTAPPPVTDEELLREMPTIKATDVNGKPFTVSPEDKKATLFYFFTPGGSRAVIDDIQQMEEEGEARGFRVVGVVTRGGKPENRTTEAVRAFVAEHHITFPVYVEYDAMGLNEIEKQVGNYGGSFYVLYDAEGKLRSDANFTYVHELRDVINYIAPLVKP